MKAVIMAGGEGSRLRPLTLTRPKPMLPVGNRPLLGHILGLLKQHGITDVVIAVRYLPTAIQDYFGDGRSIGMTIDYVIEDSPLGTAGCVKNAEALLPSHEPFLVLSGDALTDFDLTALVEHHREREALITVALYQVPNPLEYGVINYAEDGRITQFVEKPGWGEVTSDAVNTGIYVMQPDVLARIPPGQNLDWSQDIFPAMLAQGEALHAYLAGGYWCDTGTLTEFHRANGDLLNGLVRLEEELGEHIGGGIWTGGQVEIARDAQLFGPIYLGQEVKIMGGVVIHGPAVIRDYTVLDNRVHIDRSIVMRNCYLGEGAEVHGAVIGRQCSIKARAVLFEGTVVGDRTVIGEGAVIQPGVKIWPNKEVDAMATVSYSIIWGSRGRRVLFGRYGVTGVVNVDLTPDMVARLGAAFGSVLPKGSTVTINRDPHRSPRMLKRALISGLPSAGNNVVDLRTVPIPVARYYTRAIGAAGGVHVRLSPYDQRVVDIRFIDKKGMNLTRERERAVEQAYFREDFRRVYMDEIGNIDYALDVAEVYIRGYLNAVDAKAIRQAGFKIVVDYAHAPAADVLPNLLEELNVEAVPLNARIDVNKIALSQEDFLAERAQLATITGALGDTSLGVRLDIGGERIFVADDTGTAVPDSVLCAAMATLMFKTYPGSTIVVPVDQSRVLELLAERHGGHVRRCPVDLQSLMEAAADGDVTMGADGTGGFVYPGLHPAIDGLMAVGKLLELLARQRTKLSDVISELPPFFMASTQAEVTWESKGRIMRCVLEQFSGCRNETMDGIKVYLDDGEWVLIRPDADRAMFQVVAEARSSPVALEIVAKYTRLVTSLVQSTCPAAMRPETMQLGG